jgi:3-hydroxymyristoyl/3-hydroxydecanoyl-(acyl carrier protein) dehydratase
MKYFTKNSLMPGVLIIVSRCKYKKVFFFLKQGINRDPQVHKHSSL